jgi:hypothetical protein
MWASFLIYLIPSFLLLYLAIGCIRGINKQSMIKKYQYDYYVAQPMSLIGSLIHDLGYGISRLTPFYISIGLIALSCFIFFILN